MLTFLPPFCHVLRSGFDFWHATNSSGAQFLIPDHSLFFDFFFFVFKLCSECQTAALVSLRPQRQYHSAQILTKSQPRAVCQSLIDPVILILFAQTWKHWRKKVCMTCFCQYKCLFPFFLHLFLDADTCRHFIAWAVTCCLLASFILFQCLFYRRSRTWSRR